MLDGEAEFELDGRLSRAGAGSFVLVPGGVAHTFGATAGAPAHVLVLHAPALDDYFRELDELWSGGATPSRGGSAADAPPRHAAGGVISWFKACASRVGWCQAGMSRDPGTLTPRCSSEVSCLPSHRASWNPLTRVADGLDGKE